ncbi:hypothetical protein FACS1894216_18200 [Synergistales bacterium]|nr:hypothetical protein FACS1894216_18200 [Synergistales bacterium]
MTKMISAKKWLLSFISIILVLFVVCGSVVYWLDPLIQYRYDNRMRFFTTDAFSLMAGIIKNRDYDSAVIGSSMTQNFEMDWFRQEMGVNPAKLTTGNMQLNDIIQLYDAVQIAGKAKKFFINLDLGGFNAIDINEPINNNIKAYLYNSNKPDDFKYILRYDVWFRLIPLNLALNALNDMGISMPEKIYKKTDIDDMSYWADDFVFSKDVVIGIYKDKDNPYNPKKQEITEARMKHNIDEFLVHILRARKEGQSIVFMFPPYSALYWYDTQQNGTFKNFMDAKEFFIDKLDGVKDVRIVDMQDIPEITDLDHYKDITHYDTYIQGIYAESIKDGRLDVTQETFPQRKARLENLIKRFAEDNSDWLD